MASSRSLGTLTLDLILKAGGFTAGLDKAARDTDKRLSDIERRAYKFGQALGTGLKVGASLAAAALGALSVAVGKAINNADAIRDLSIRLGVGTETLSAYAYAAQQTGTDMDALGRGMKILAKNALDSLKPLSEQGRIFKALQIDAKDAATGGVKDLGQLIPEIAAKFKAMEDGTTKTALALALFGKSGLDLIEFLNQGSDGITTLTDRARELGVTIDSQTASAADEFKDTLADLKAILAGGALTIAKELLPALKDAAAALLAIAKEGDLASNVASVFTGILNAGIGTIDAYNNAVNRVSIAFEVAAKSAAGFAEIQKNLSVGGLFNEGSVAGGIQKITDAMKDGQAQLDSLRKAQDSLFKGVSSRVLSGQGSGSPMNQTALQNALAGIGGKTSKARSGKSDAEREAEKVAKAIRQMTDAQKDFEVQLNDNGNPIAKEYAQNLADIADKAEKFAQDGVPAEKIAAFVEKMKELATSIQSKELAEFQKEFTDDTLALAAATQGPGAAGMLTYSQAVEELDKQLKNGLITQAQYQERIEAMVTPFQDVISALSLEAEAITRTAEQQEIYNQQKLAGVDAMSEEGRAIEEMVKANGRLAESYGFINDAKTDLADAFTDFVTGAKSAKEAFGDFADSIYKRAIQLLADKAVEALFSAFSGTGTSSAGSGAGGWGQLFSSLFGGARAMGGGVNSGQMYRVNENGPEMLSVGSRDYLMMGSQSGRVTPSHMMGAGGGNTTIINVQPTTTRRTASQIAQANERRQRTASRRNG